MNKNNPNDNVEILSITQGVDGYLGWELVEYRTTDGKPPHPDSDAVRRGIVSVPSHETFVEERRLPPSPQLEGKSDLLDSRGQEEPPYRISH